MSAVFLCKAYLRFFAVFFFAVVFFTAFFFAAIFLFLIILGSTYDLDIDLFSHVCVKRQDVDKFFFFM